MATSAQVQQLYITYFGRGADPDGLRFWTNDTTTPLEAIANGFAATPEFAQTITGKTASQVVNQFYISLFGRSAEPAGLNYWVDLLNRGLTTFQQVGLNISSAALALPSTNTDNIAVTSKITASQNWTTEVGKTTAGILAYTGQPGIDAGVAFITPVLTTATIPTAAQTTAAVSNLIASNSGVGQTADLSVFDDIFTPTSAVRINGATLIETLPFRFTSESQSVSATVGTIQAADRLVDPSALDSDNFNITIPPGFAFADLTTINIENFKFFLNGALGGLTFDFNDGGNTQTGVKTVVVSGTISTPGNFFIRRFADAGATVLDASGVTTPGANGGVGSDAVLVLGAGNPAVTMTGGAGNDTLIGGDGADVISGNAGIDQLTGNGGADTINGGSGADVINGGDGNDSISGGLDADNISGGAGNDNLFGNEGNDIINGNLGNDTFTGGTGADELTGGGGVNQFLYGSLTQLVTDTGITQATSDTITDFATGIDKLQTGLAGTGTNFKTLGVFGTYDLAKTGAQSPAGFDGAVQYVYATFAGTGVLFVDTDANNTADASILFSVPPVPALAFSDIIA